MSKVASPSGRSPCSYGTISQTGSNTKTKRVSVSSQQSIIEDFSMMGVADESRVSLNQESPWESDDNDSTSETAPLFASPIYNVSEDGPSRIVRRKSSTETTDSVRCDCHEPPKPTDKASRNRLTIACIVVLLFMIGEVVGWLDLKM